MGVAEEGGGAEPASDDGDRERSRVTGAEAPWAERTKGVVEVARLADI